jgi:hypothetical protein
MSLRRVFRESEGHGDDLPVDPKGILELPEKVTVRSAGKFHCGRSEESRDPEDASLT